MTKRLPPALRPNPTLPTFFDGKSPADQATRSGVLDAWACHCRATGNTPGNVLAVPSAS